MGTGSSVPVQILQGVAKGKLFCAGGKPSAPLFRPFTDEDKLDGEAREGEAGADRDRMLMEHLPMVRYLARRIHERLPQHVELDDLISAGVVGLSSGPGRTPARCTFLFKEITPNGTVALMLACSTPGNAPSRSLKLRYKSWERCLS